MHIVELIGRIFLSVLFLIEGIGKLFTQEQVITYMEDYGVPGILFIPAVIVEILFPLLLIVGYKTRLAALVLALFTLTVTIIFHTDFDDGMQLISFLKNLAITGGFMIVIAYGSNKFSLDHFLKSNSE
jgi:putative oxidoreductase|tara:strand:+ start:56 stop:439 length:384 start_codon:yes stop_codon:yes gene_type:complete